MLRLHLTVKGPVEEDKGPVGKPWNYGVYHTRRGGIAEGLPDRKNAEMPLSSHSLIPLLLAAFAVDSAGQQVPQDPRPTRARDLGIRFEGTPGPLNAITDVGSVHVGHTTLIRGEDIRTGVTAVFPRGDARGDPVFAGWFALNGNGEMTGTTWIEESGFLEGPICITNTHSVGTVRDAIIGWQVERGSKFQAWSLPVVAETYDGYLNDIDGFHVKSEHVFAALDGATSGPVDEGNVGGGTGMMCLGFKGGIGTASRVVFLGDAEYTLGVLVQSNFGRADQLRIDGVPVGRELRARRIREDQQEEEFGSIIVVVATDAPLVAHQLKRIARRVSMGVARVGGTAGNGSGDIFVAFSTANAGAASASLATEISILANSRLSALFDATVQATEEAIINAMVAAETMTGRDGHRSQAMPHERVREVLKKYNRLDK